MDEFFLSKHVNKNMEMNQWLKNKRLFCGYGILNVYFQFSTYVLNSFT